MKKRPQTPQPQAGATPQSVIAAFDFLIAKIEMAAEDPAHKVKLLMQVGNQFNVNLKAASEESAAYIESVLLEKRTANRKVQALKLTDANRAADE